MENENYSLVAVKRQWVPEWLWKCFCIRFPFFGGLGVIQPFRFFLTTPVKPKPEPQHPQCIWCEGQKHHLEPEMDEENPEPYLQCRHCSYSRPMTDEEAEADWDDWDAPEA
jgi:hypothetical protein